MATKTAPRPQGAGWAPVGGNTVEWGNTPGKSVQGIYVARREVQANNRPTLLYDLRQSDGSIISVWDTMVLHQKFAALDPDGTWEVFIAFTGYGKRKGRNNPPRLFDFQARRIAKKR